METSARSGRQPKCGIQKHVLQFFCFRSCTTYHLEGVVSHPSVCSAENSGLGKGGSCAVEGRSLVFGMANPTIFASQPNVLISVCCSRTNRGLEKRYGIVCGDLVAMSSLYRLVLRKLLGCKILVEHCATLNTKHRSITPAKCCRTREMFSKCRQLMRDSPRI